MTIDRQILVASPGTGKTTRLLSKVEDLLAKGVAPERICYTTYTKAGADEARDRAIKRFGSGNGSYRYFKTMHALAYAELGSPKIAETEPLFFKELFKKSGVPCTFISRGNPLFGVEREAPKFLGDLYLTIYNLSRNTFEDARSIALMTPQFQWVEWSGYEQFIKIYEQMKAFYQMLDFTDVLERFIRYEDIQLPIDYLFVDEAQDLTPLQWKMVRKIEANARQCVVAGDDKQAVYEWAGARPADLIDLTGTREILEKSYRLKDEMVSFSEGIAGKISKKSNYSIKGSGSGGRVSYIQSINSLDLSSGSWLLLARLNRDLDLYRQHCELHGYRYISSGNSTDETIYESIRVWESLRTGMWMPITEILKVMPMLRSGESIKRGAKKDLEELDKNVTLNMDTLREKHGITAQGPWDEVFRMSSEERARITRTSKREGLHSAPRIKILTIHGSKGLEAENVCLIPKLSPSCEQTLDKNPDSEHRVFYVGATRAKNNLYILQGNEREYQF